MSWSTQMDDATMLPSLALGMSRRRAGPQVDPSALGRENSTMTVTIETASPQDLALSVHDLTINLPPGMERPHAVENVSFELERGKILCIIGESGSGKSVTANALMGFLPSRSRLPRGLSTWKA